MAKRRRRRLSRSRPSGSRPSGSTAVARRSPGKFARRRLTGPSRNVLLQTVGAFGAAAVGSASLAVTWQARRQAANQETVLRFGSAVQPDGTIGRPVQPLYLVGGGLLLTAALMKKSKLWVRGALAGAGTGLITVPLVQRWSSERLSLPGA